MDAHPRSGKHVLQAVFELDRKRYNGLETPNCFRKADSLPVSLTRPPELGEFVLDNLTPFAEAQEEKYRKRIELLSFDSEPDQDLLAPYYDAKRRAKVVGMKMEEEKASSGTPMKDGRKQVMEKVSERDVEPE